VVVRAAADDLLRRLKEAVSKEAVASKKAGGDREVSNHTISIIQLRGEIFIPAMTGMLRDARCAPVQLTPKVHAVTSDDT